MKTNELRSETLIPKLHFKAWFMANTWTTTWSLNSLFEKLGADLVTTMTSFIKGQ